MPSASSACCWTSRNHPLTANRSKNRQTCHCILDTGCRRDLRHLWWSQQLSTTVPESAVTVLEVMFPELLDTTITIAIANPGTGVTVNELVVRALPDRRPPLRPLHVDDTDTGVTELDLIVALRWLADQQSSTQSRVVNLTITDTDVTAAGIDNLQQLFNENSDRVDLNSDGRANQLDLRILLRHISGLSDAALAEQGGSEDIIRLLLQQPDTARPLQNSGAAPAG